MQQVLFGIIQDIASEFPVSSRARYQAAAATFRIPYWDWAAIPPSGQSIFPPSVTNSSDIQVIGSNGLPTTIKNPLYSHKFNPLNTNDFPRSPVSDLSRISA